MIRNAWRIFVYSWKNLTRNAWISLATVFVFMLALLSVNVLLGVQAMAGRVITALEDRVDITVTFKSDTPQAVYDQARFYLRSLSQVKDIKEVSKEEALVQFKATHKDDPAVLSALDEVGGSPFGPQLVVKAHRTEDYPFLTQAIQNPQYKQFIEKQTYDTHDGAIAIVQQIGDHVRLFVSALIAIFALFGLMIAFNAIRVAIYTQREEIGIMRLVGASSLFIRGPFILEGIWLAFIAFTFASGLTAGAVTWVEPMLRRLFDGQAAGLQEYFLLNLPLLLLFQLGGLALLAILSSWMAVGKYIKR